MSTILLEGMIFGRPILAVAFNDQKHSWSADKVSRMHHFKEIYENPDILICRDRDEMFTKILQLYLNSDNIDLCNRLKKFYKYFVNLDGPTYSEKLSLELNNFLIKRYDLSSSDTLQKQRGKKRPENSVRLHLTGQLLLSYLKNYYYFLKTSLFFILNIPLSILKRIHP